MEYIKEQTASINGNPNSSDSQHKHNKNIDEELNELLNSPLGKAIVEKRDIAFYIPSEKFKESAMFLLNCYVEDLQEDYDSSITLPEHKSIHFAIGESAPKWDGELDSKGRVIISYTGMARL